MIDQIVTNNETSCQLVHLWWWYGGGGVPIATLHSSPQQKINKSTFTDVSLGSYLDSGTVISNHVAIHFTLHGPVRCCTMLQHPPLGRQLTCSFIIQTISSITYTTKKNRMQNWLHKYDAISYVYSDLLQSIIIIAITECCRLAS